MPTGYLTPWACFSLAIAAGPVFATSSVIAYTILAVAFKDGAGIIKAVSDAMVDYRHY